MYPQPKERKDKYVHGTSVSKDPVPKFAGTFTLSNLGMFGVDRFDAILPPGQVSPGKVGAVSAIMKLTGFFAEYPSWFPGVSICSFSAAPILRPRFYWSNHGVLHCLVLMWKVYILSLPFKRKYNSFRYL